MAEAGFVQLETNTDFVRLEDNTGNVLLEADEFALAMAIVRAENPACVVRPENTTALVRPEDDTSRGRKVKVYQKDPDGTKKVVIDFSDWLGSSTIASVTWTLDAGITGANNSNTNTTVTNYISSGVLDGEYYVKACITTNDAVARIECRSVLVRVVRQAA